MSVEDHTLWMTIYEIVESSVGVLTTPKAPMGFTIIVQYEAAIHTSRMHVSSKIIYWSKGHSYIQFRGCI
jgi:hypothetical protein